MVLSYILELLYHFNVIFYIVSSNDKKMLSSNKCKNNGEEILKKVPIERK